MKESESEFLFNVLFSGSTVNAFHISSTTSWILIQDFMLPVCVKLVTSRKYSDYNVNG